jgi:selenocysteine-specific elongation factor
VSSITGAGVEALNAHLLAESERQDARATRGHFRMAIDRCFTLAGVGTVVTGTVHAGSVRVGDPAVVVPGAHGALATRVRSIHAQDRASPAGAAGQRCALNLAGLEKAQIERGMWVQSPTLANVTERFDATLTLSGRETKALGSTTVHLHHGTADAMARVAGLDVTRVEPGESALVSLTIDRPLAVCRGDRFVLRDASAQRTLGGGRVLDVTPLGATARRGRRTPARLQLLTALRDASDVDALHAWLSQQPVPLPRLAACWNLNDDERQSLLAAANARVAAGIAFADGHWQRLRRDVLAAIESSHLREPEMPGVEQLRLRRMVAPGIDGDAFGAVIDEQLGQQVLVRRGAFLALPSHKAELGRDQRVRWERIRPLLMERRFEPPRVRDIARETGIPEVEVRHLLKTVARVGEVMLVAHDHFFLASAVAELADIAGDIASTHGAARAAEFRDRIGSGRKLAIQILEFFDRVGYTRRVRDDHLIRRANPWHA